MSLAIVILLDSGAIVFTDSRSVSCDFSKSESGVKKTAVLIHKGKLAVVAFTGDGEINGKLTFDILAESAAQNGKTETLPELLVASVKIAFEADVADFPWENQGDKEKYLREAKVVLHILTAPNKHHLWEVAPLTVKNHPFQDGANESFSGVRMVDCFTGNYRHWDLNAIRLLLPKCIDQLCTNEWSCGYPVDVTTWKHGGVPETTRCADLAALDAHLSSLTM